MFHEEKHDWKKIQARYYNDYSDRVNQKIQEATEGGDQDALKIWTALNNDLVRSKKIGIKQVFIPEAGKRDLCGTCHIGMENSLFADAKNPLKAHPAAILKKHKINNFGCTLCHHGQGIALKMDKAHGFEHNWEEPKLPSKYIQASCFGCHENVHGLEGAEVAATGKTLFTDNGCFGCHNANIIQNLPYFSTPLNGISQKITNESYIFKWIENPEELRPGTSMPKFRLKEEELRHVAAYVYSLKAVNEINSPSLKEGVSALGKKLFTEKGCIACHSDTRKDPSLKKRVPKIADAGLKLNKKWLDAWIDSPSSVNPDTTMPNVELTQNEISDLSTYVLTLKDEMVNEKLVFNYKSGNPEEGKKLVQSFGCYGCHKIGSMENQALVGVDVGEVAKKRMEELPFGNSTVNHTKWDWIFNKIKQPDIYTTEDMPLKMPGYMLDEKELDALTTFYLNNRLYDLTDTLIVRNTADTHIGEKGNFLIGHFNCKGCHEIFTGELPRITNYMELKTMIPPRIVDEAERVQPQWLFQYINRPFAMRPWLKIRMPQFNISYEDKNLLIGYFASILPEAKRSLNKIPYEPQLVRADYDAETIQMGEYRVVTDKCMQCHPVSLDGGLPEGKKLEDLSINLMLAKTRLRPDWIINFMRNPDDYAGKDTKMPFVFYTPDRVPRIPDPEMWLKYATWYLMFMEKVPETKAVEENVREEADVDWTDY